jgi:hypothetical protein
VQVPLLVALLAAVISAVMDLRVHVTQANTTRHETGAAIDPHVQITHAVDEQQPASIKFNGTTRSSSVCTSTDHLHLDHPDNGLVSFRHIPARILFVYYIVDALTIH